MKRIRECSGSSDDNDECCKRKKSSSLCQFFECKTYATFNHEGSKKGLYCATHKLPNMVDVKHKRCCYDGCTKGPVFNYEGQPLRSVIVAIY